MRNNSFCDQQSREYAARSTLTALMVCGTMALAGCGDGGTSSSGPQQDIPAAFDAAAGAISAKGYKLANCVAIADDKAKLDCYGALGFKDKGDVADVEALAGASDILAGKSWQITAPSPGGSDSFQGSALLTLATLANQGPMAFRNTRILLQCPAEWGGPTNQQWGASIGLPFDVSYDSVGNNRGTMAIDVDGKTFTAVQFSRSSFNVAADQATAFRDAVVSGKTLSFTVKTLDGKTGSTSTALPDNADGLKGYFAKFCA